MFMIKAIVLTGVLFLYVNFLLLYGYGYRDVFMLDLPSFYGASSAVFKLHQTPYALNVLNQNFNQALYSYVYPPPSLLFFYPLSLLSYDQARILMLALNHGLVLLTTYLTLKVLNISIAKNSLKAAFLFGYLLFFQPTIMTLYYGQVGLIVLSLLLAFWLFAERNHSIAAGAMLALAILLKVYPALFLPLLLLSRRYREVGAALAWIALISLVTALVLPLSLWSDWFTNVVLVGGYGHVPPDLLVPAVVWNYSLYGFFARMFTDTIWTKGLLTHPAGMQTAIICTYIAVAVVMAVSCLAVAKGRVRSTQTRISQVMMIGLPLMFLIAPLSWTHHVVHLIPLVAGLMLTRPAIQPRYLIYYRLLAGIIALICLTHESPLYFLAVLLIWLLNIVQIVQPDRLLAQGEPPAGAHYVQSEGDPGAA
jgi:alpha-1,2-mannosyltransferase